MLTKSPLETRAVLLGTALLLTLACTYSVMLSGR
jgi:hypothetical protein